MLVNLFPAPYYGAGSFSSATSGNLNMPDLSAAPKFLIPSMRIDDAPRSGQICEFSTDNLKSSTTKSVDDDATKICRRAAGRSVILINESSPKK